MPDTKQHSSWWLIGRSLLPSISSVTACVVGSIFIVGSGVVLTSLNHGTILPGAFEGELSALYSNVIVRPLEIISNSSPWSVGITMLIWGLVGLILYSLVEFVIKAYQDIHDSSHDIQYVDENTVVRHPLESSIFKVLAWRLIIGAIGVRLILYIQPLMKQTSDTVDRLVLGDISLSASIIAVCGLMALWIAVIHIAIVFLRLYTLRTRLHGDYID